MNFLEEIEKFLPDFEDNCCKKQNTIPYVPRGVLNIEAFYWWSMVAAYKPDMILESGVAKGRSTEVLARAQRMYDIPKHYAFDVDESEAKFVRRRLKGYKTEYKVQDSVKGFAEAFKSNRGNAVVIIDGPKSSKGIKAVFDVLAANQDRILAVGSHDCDPGAKVRDFFALHAKKLTSKKLVFTTPNPKLSHLNDCILDDIWLQRGKDTKNLLLKSNFVGVCI